MLEKFFGNPEVSLELIKANPLRLARTERRVTQADLAQASGLAQPLIANWERGKRLMTPEGARQLAKILDLDHGDFFLAMLRWAGRIDPPRVKAPKSNGDTPNGPQVVVARHTAGSTPQNAITLTNLAKRGDCARVILFASPTDDPDGAGDNDNDSPSTNWPLLYAVADMLITDQVIARIVMDGFFLTAARYPRYREVDAVLDELERLPHAFFCPRRAPFTGDLTPDQAASALIKIGGFLPFTSASRPDFFQLLCTLSEESYRNYGRY